MSWKHLTLDKAFWFQEGPGVRKWQFRNTGIKLLNVSNITKNGEINLSKTERCLDPDEANGKYKHFLVDADDLVIASSGISIDDDGLLRTRGSFIRQEHLPLCMNTSTIRFKAIEGVSDLSFLRHWLQSTEFRRQITREVTGIAQKNFGPSHLSKILINLPPLSEQKRIAEILDKADLIRRKREKAIELTDSFLRSVFLEMFGDPVSNPKSWNVMPLKQLTSKIGSGATPRGGEASYQASGITLIRSMNVRKLSFAKKGLVYLDDDQADQLSNVDVKYDDVLLNITGASVCRCCVVDPSVLPARVNQHVAIIRSLKEQIEPRYLAHLINSPNFQQFLLNKARGAGATREALTKAQIEELLIQVPPMTIQHKFRDLCIKVGQVNHNQSSSFGLLESLASSLQNHLFGRSVATEPHNDFRAEAAHAL